jgi:hypothetical protein
LLPKDALKDLLCQKGLSRTDKLLLCLAVDVSRAKAVGEIKAMAVEAGLRVAKTWNVSDILGRASELAVRTGVGWELTGSGTQRIATLAGPM